LMKEMQKVFRRPTDPKTMALYRVAAINPEFYKYFL